VSLWTWLEKRVFTVVVPSATGGVLVLLLLLVFCCCARPRKLCLLLLTHPNPALGPLYMPEAMRREYAADLGFRRVPGYLWGFWRPRPLADRSTNEPDEEGSSNFELRADPQEVTCRSGPYGRVVASPRSAKSGAASPSSKYVDSAASAARVAAAAVHASSIGEMREGSSKPWAGHSNPSYRYFYGPASPRSPPTVPPAAPVALSTGLQSKLGFAAPARAHDAALPSRALSPRSLPPATLGSCLDGADDPTFSSLALAGLGRSPSWSASWSPRSPWRPRSSLGMDMLPLPMLGLGPEEGSDSEGPFSPGSIMDARTTSLLEKDLLRSQLQCGGAHAEHAAHEVQGASPRGNNEPPDSPLSAGGHSASWSESNKSGISAATGNTTHTCREALASLRLLASTMIGSSRPTGADAETASLGWASPRGAGANCAASPPATPNHERSRSISATLADLRSFHSADDVALSPRAASCGAGEGFTEAEPVFAATASEADSASLRSLRASITSDGLERSSTASLEPPHQRPARASNVCAPGALAAAAQRVAALRSAESRARSGGIGVPSLREGRYLTPLPEGMPPDVELADDSEPATGWFARLFK